jgi:hypothetical protein
VEVVPGLHFAANDPETQDLLTYQQQLLVLAPGATRSFPLRALCMEQQDRGPANSPYSLRGFAGNGLRPLSDSLQKYPALADAYGQYFVWAMADQASVYDLDVAPSQLRAANNLLRYLHGTTGRPVGKAVASGAERPSIKTFTRNVAFNFHSPTAEVVSLKVFGRDGRERQTLMKSKVVPAGVQQYSFGVNTILGRNEPAAFTVRLLNAAGQVLHEVKVDEAEPEAAAKPAQEAFDFRFTLDKPVKNARLRVRLADGTLVEEVRQLAYLPAGNHQYRWTFYHLRPAGTAFVVRMETTDGKPLAQRTFEPTAP